MRAFACDVTVYFVDIISRVGHLCSYPGDRHPEAELIHFAVRSPLPVSHGDSFSGHHGALRRVARQIWTLQMAVDQGCPAYPVWPDRTCGRHLHQPRGHRQVLHVNKPSLVHVSCVSCCSLLPSNGVHLTST